MAARIRTAWSSDAVLRHAAVYDGIDHATGRERRRWHPAGNEQGDVERLAARLASDLQGRNDQVRALTFGAYLATRWLPGKRVVLADSTYAGYRRNVETHILPALGRIGLRRLRSHHLETLYDTLLHPTDGSHALSPKNACEIHLVIRGALADAVRRGLITRNVALIANAPRLRSIPKVEQQAWTAQELQQFLHAAAGHRHFPALSPAALTGMRRNKLLGLRWEDFHEDAATVSVNRGLVAVDYQMRETRSKTASARRRIDLDPTTVDVMSAWRSWQAAEQWAAGVESHGWMFTDPDGNPIHPHSISQSFERIARRAGVRLIRLHDRRHTPTAPC
jgi:integrase